MTRNSAIFLNLYIVPLMAALLSLIGYLQGGTGFFIIDLILYGIASFCVYSFSFFFINFQTKLNSIFSVTLFFAILSWHTYLISKILLSPIFLIYVHLILFSRRNESMEIDLDKSILSFIIKFLPKRNFLIIASYILLSFIVAYFFRT